jgi:hypothetical protein
MGAASNDEVTRAELMEAKRALMATRGELLKSQIVAATRHDVIRLLGYISNRPCIPDLSAMLPAEVEVRTVFASELRDLASHMREQALKFEGIALQLDTAH